MRINVTSYEYILSQLANVSDDDLSLPWNTYPCLEWGMGRTASGHWGYGTAWSNGINWKAHRLAYHIVKGPIESGLYVCHRCDNPPCFRPSHLFLGDNADNGRDRRSKGRAARMFGECNPLAKLTQSDAEMIRKLYSEGATVNHLTNLFGIGSRTVLNVINGTSWITSKVVQPLTKEYKSLAIRPRKLTTMQIFNVELSNVKDDDLGIQWDAYPCLIWKRSTSTGYGVLWNGTQTVLAHRLAYERAKGPIPENYDICHHCDVRACYRPSHLFAGTVSQNMQDMIAKGRGESRIHRGEGNCNAVACESDVHKIRAMISSGISQTEISKSLGLSLSIVNRIVLGRTWNHIPHGAHTCSL